MRRLDVIIPVKNEAADLPDLVRRIHNCLKKANIAYRLVIVDDYSTDSTPTVVKKLTKDYPIITLLKEGKPGKVYSILEGAEKTSSEYVAILDPESEYPPEALPEMFAKVAEHGIVVASRRLVPRLGRWLSKKLLLGMDCDTQSGIMVFHRHILAHIRPSDIDSQTLGIPLLYTALELGCTIGQVDVDLKTRLRSASKAGFPAAWRQVARQAVKLHLAHRKAYEIPAESVSSPLGAGVIHHRHRFITHTRLPQHQSAMDTFLPWQKHLLIALFTLTLVAFAVKPFTAASWAIAILTAIYFLDVFFNGFIIAKSLRNPPEMSFSPEQLGNLSPRGLPVYSVLCPLYREARVLPEFVKNIEAIDWPKDKMDVLLLLEEDDKETRQAAASLNLPDYIKVVVVPHSLPKTKPKACNYGLSYVRGEYTVIYDAEDRPDPLQLKKAYLGFKKSSPKVVCLQAKLNYYNPKHNLLTRLFTAEYTLWFDVVLPGLQSIETTIPLGGTSNHFRTKVLREIHGWDAFNVTEDCDLGVRLFSLGYRTAIIDSTTYEEANSRIGSWFRQRSRWIKGYLQTFLVHNRHPLRFVRTHGVHAFIFQLLVGGKNAFVLINPILWLITISYFLFRRTLGPTIEALYPAPIFYMAVFSMLAGNFLSMYYYMLGCARRGTWWLVKYVYLVPFYWFLMSLAAVKAVNQLLFKPHYWEKTMHGLHLAPKVRFSLPRISWTFPRPLPKPAYAAGSFLVASNMLANVFNFLYNAFLGRAVGLADFGLISLFGSILSLLQIPTGALGRTVSYQSAFLQGKHHQPATAFWQTVRRRSFAVSLAVTVFWLLATPLLSRFFNSGSTMPFYMFTPIVTLSAISAVDGGFLSGNLKFAVLALAGIAAGAVKLATAYVSVAFSLSDLVYLAIPVSVFFSFLVMRRAAISLPKGNLRAGTFPVNFLTTSFASNLSMASFLGADLILAKHFLEPETAGQYAILSLAGKMVYFLGSLFNQFITPLVAQARGAGRSHRRLFYSLLAAAFFSGLAGYLVVGIYGYITVPLFFGVKSLPILKFLPAYTLSMVLLAVGTAIVSYHQTLKQYVFGYTGLAVSAIQVAAFWLYHDSIPSFVGVVQGTVVLYLAINILLHFLSPRFDIISRNLADLRELLFPARGMPESTGGLRILILNWRDIRHKWAGGAEVYVHELARNWVKKGNQVTLFCGNDGHCPRREVIDGVEIIRRGGTYMVYVWAFLYYIFRFRTHFDAIVDSENGIPFFAPLYSRIPTFLLVHHVHQNYFQRYLKSPLSDIARILEADVMPRVYRDLPVVTVSESSKKDLLNFKSFREENISVVNPGVSPDLTPSYPKTSQPSFLYLGRIRPYKNIDVAIRAFCLVVKKYPQATLTVAGMGENQKELATLSKTLGISDRVFFTGRVDEATKRRLLGESWVMLQPSSFEGWGITVLEANACGTPVIASDTEGLRDSVVDTKTGWLLPVRDTGTWASAMKSMIEYPTNLERLSANAVKWAKSFDWDKNSDKFLGLISEDIYERKAAFEKPVYRYAEVKNG